MKIINSRFYNRKYEEKITKTMEFFSQSSFQERTKRGRTEVPFYYVIPLCSFPLRYQKCSCGFLDVVAVSV